MKINSIKTMATILLAATTAKAMDNAVVMTVEDLQQFEQQTGRSANTQKRLLDMGIILSSNKPDIYVFNDAILSKLTDQDVISLVSDLMNWLTKGEVVPKQKQPGKMTPSSQDVGGGA
jgi:hypothetical protein